MVWKLAHALLLALASVALSEGEQVLIRNDVPRVDTRGEILNAHDGSLMRHGGVWYLYGTVYENCVQKGPYCTPPCGYDPNTFSLYTSADNMKTWTFVSDNIMPAMSKDNQHINYWMPDVKYNPTTKQFVMQYWSSACGFHKPCAEVATASTPEGPFTPLPPMPLRGGVPSDQMGLVVDYGDGSGTPKAYVRHNTVGPPRSHVIEELDETWTNTTGRWAPIMAKPSWPWLDGGGMFRAPPAHEGAPPGPMVFMTGSDCCFCSWGSDTRIFTARHPLGPWHPGTLQGEAPYTPDDDAAQAPTCDLAGNWTCVSSATYKCPDDHWSVVTGGLRPDGNFTATSGAGKAYNGYVEHNGYVVLPGVAPVWPLGVATSADGKSVGCDRVRWYGDETAFWCRDGADCATPSPLDATQINYCADGSLPKSYGPSSPPWINPCDNDNPWGTNFTVPAQQFNVIVVSPGATDDGPTSANATVMYYGERSKTAPDGLKSHNYQAWAPLSFASNGTVLPMTFPPSFTISI